MARLMLITSLAWVAGVLACSYIENREFEYATFEEATARGAFPDCATVPRYLLPPSSYAIKVRFNTDREETWIRFESNDLNWGSELSECVAADDEVEFPFGYPRWWPKALSAEGAREKALDEFRVYECRAAATCRGRWDLGLRNQVLALKKDEPVGYFWRSPLRSSWLNERRYVYKTLEETMAGASCPDCGLVPGTLLPPSSYNIEVQVNTDDQETWIRFRSKDLNWGNELSECVVADNEIEFPSWYPYLWPKALSADGVRESASEEYRLFECRVAATCQGKCDWGPRKLLLALRKDEPIGYLWRSALRSSPLDEKAEEATKSEIQE